MFYELGLNTHSQSRKTSEKTTSVAIIVAQGQPVVAMVKDVLYELGLHSQSQSQSC